MKRQLLFLGCAVFIATSAYAANTNNWFVNTATPVGHATATLQAQPESMTTLQAQVTAQMEQDFNDYRLNPNTYGVSVDSISQPYSNAKGH